MKQLAPKVLSIIAIAVAAFFVCGYVLPYGAPVTVVNADRVRIVRGDGFYRTLTYQINRSTGNETLVIAGLTGYTRVEYGGACKCIVDYSKHRVGTDKDALYVSRRTMKEDKAFCLVGVEVTSDPYKGQYIELGFWRSLDELKPFFDEAQTLLDGTRSRFADVIPKS